MKSTGCTYISRKEQELKALMPNVDNQEEYQNLISLVYKQGSYWMYHSKSLHDDSFKNHAERVWRIVKYESYQANKINTLRVIQGDVIKFGRVRFQVKKLVVHENDIESASVVVDEQHSHDATSLPNRSNAHQDASLTQNQFRLLTTEQDQGNSLNNNGAVNTEPDTRMTQNFNKETAGFDNRPFQFDDGFIKQQEQEIRLKSAALLHQNTGNRSADVINCKICLSEEDANNPMISPCNCTGSMKYIHLECLKEWLEGKKHMKETPYVNSYIWKNLECEICKSSYNDMITLKDGQEVSLLRYSVHPDAQSYMIIESVTNTTSKTIHIINFNARRKVKVVSFFSIFINKQGRGQNAEVRITDISVSRFHTLIKLSKNGEVIISDNQSKFGSLVQINNPVPIKFSHPLYVQIGRSVLVLFSINRFTCLQRCFCALQKSRRGDQCLHYDEVSKFFPIEFSHMFEQYSQSRTRPQINNKLDKISLSYPLPPQNVNGQKSLPQVTTNLRQQQLEISNMSQNENQRAFDYEQEEINQQDVQIADQLQGNHLRNQSTIPYLREEDRQPSVAIEFVTQPERIDSDNRQQIVNNLVQQMNSMRQTNNLAISNGHRISLSDGNNQLVSDSTDFQAQAAGQIGAGPISFNLTNLPVLDEQHEEEEEEKEGQSQNLNRYEVMSRNPLSILNSQRNRQEDELLSERSDIPYRINSKVLVKIFESNDGNNSTVNNPKNIKSFQGIPQVNLIASPQMSNRNPSLFSMSRYNDQEEDEEMQRVDYLEPFEQRVEEAKISQLQLLESQLQNQDMSREYQQAMMNKNRSLFTNFDKQITQRRQNSSLLTNIQEAANAQPTNTNFSVLNYESQEFQPVDQSQLQFRKSLKKMQNQ